MVSSKCLAVVLYGLIRLCKMVYKLGHPNLWLMPDPENYDETLVRLVKKTDNTLENGRIQFNRIKIDIVVFLMLFDL